jgi:leucyl/phenylalanyl-tRNA--protein transferase
MFPPLDCADDDGLLEVGADLGIDTLWEAYTHGIFPWPVEGLPLLWFAPPQRAVLRFDELHLSRRRLRALRNKGFEARRNTCFRKVICACASQRAAAEGTWITSDMIEAYTWLHELGSPRFGAHSFETFRNGELVGGLYGVGIGRYFCGESMFHNCSDASTFALLSLIEYLTELGASWLDVQLQTPHFASLGAREVARADFMQMLRQELATS